MLLDCNDGVLDFQAPQTRQTINVYLRSLRDSGLGIHPLPSTLTRNCLGENIPRD